MLRSICPWFRNFVSILQFIEELNNKLQTIEMCDDLDIKILNIIMIQITFVIVMIGYYCIFTKQRNGSSVQSSYGTIKVQTQYLLHCHRDNYALLK